MLVYFLNDMILFIEIFQLYFFDLFGVFFVDNMKYSIFCLV